MLFARRERELVLQREALRARSAELRVRVAGEARVLAVPLRLADRVRAGWLWVRQHPEAIVAGVVVFVVVKPRRAWVLLRWTWRGWRTWSWARRMRAAALVLAR